MAKKSVRARSPVKDKKASPIYKNQKSNKPVSQKQSFTIVGIGASAGGLEAFEQLFSKMPQNIGMAFVLIPHLDPSHASMMTELLRRVTPIDVTEAEDGVKVEPNHVYIIPPNKEMSIFQGCLQLEAPRKVHGLRMPIDFFFRSLADDQGDKAICIILSGTGSDGTLGLRAVHGAGGMVMVQDPSSAKYAGMPASAVNTGLSDYVLPPESMPSQLIDYVKKFIGKKAKIPAPEKIESSLRKILGLVRSQTGHDFSLYKKTTLNRRIEKRMNLQNIEDTQTYYRYLYEHPQEIQLLFKDLVIGVTNFFRDPEAFETMKKKIIPQYLEKKPEGYPLRVWVPGCGTGEETFSIGMVIMECMEEMKRDFKVQIFGTDIDDEAIAQARSGIYSSNIAADVSPERLKRFFVKENSGYRVKKEIREMVVFALQDIVRDPPFTKLDLLSCRNLLIYLETELQERLLPLFHYSLKPEGVLFLGTSETIGRFADLYNVLDKRWKFFQSKKVIPAITEELRSALPWTHTSIPRGEMEEFKKPKQIDIATIAQGTLLETFAPPSVIVNEKGDILYIHGQTGKYLEPAPGHATLNILNMAREGIRFELRSGIHQAVTKAKERRYQELKVKTNDEYQLVNITVKPLTKAGEMQGLAMVSFKDVVIEKPPLKKKTRKSFSIGNKRTNELEQELAYSRESHQAAIEELQASNEELKSTNEELQSTNEEFQSTNEELDTSREELQSVNEELVTLNSEMQSKIDQLTMAENDMQILLDSTNIGIIFLDNNLCIKRFTEAARKVFNLIPNDVNRPIRDIRSNLEYDDTDRDTQKVIETLQTIEKEVHSRDRRTYLLRIMPCRTGENVIDGVVMTFTDTTLLTRPPWGLDTSKVFQMATQYAESIVDTIRESLLIMDEDLRVITANQSFYNSFQVSKEETEGHLIFELGNHQWDIPELRRLLGEILSKSEKFADFKVEHDFPTIGRKTMILNARKIVQKEAIAKPMILLAIEDITDKK